MKSTERDPAGSLRWLAISLGVLSFIAVLTAFNLTDGDLWAKLALGSHVFIQGSILAHDVFAFTPVLPEYIDHEWGAGLIFYACLKWLGPDSLMGLKIALAFGALLTAVVAGRRLGSSWNSLLALAIPCGACILPAYVPVMRSHAFTFFFFGCTVLCLEKMRAGKKWPALALPLVTLIWANVHGGFVAGLGAMGIYTSFALLELVWPLGRGESRTLASSRFKWLLLVTVASLAVTVINPYGLKFWKYLLPALLMKRPQITEWQPLPLFGHDIFIGFRILSGLVVAILLVSWRRVDRKMWPGLVLLLVTAVISWHSRRHGAFFGVATLAFVSPFVAEAYGRLVAHFPGKLLDRLKPVFGVAVLYGLLALCAAAHFLPRSSFQVLTPVGLFPVREVDILSLAQAEGNLVTPFRMGSYATWRLYPRIKVSMDGRYEAAYPESSFRLNEDFYTKFGPDWDRLLREYPVDYVILDLHTGKVRPEDLYDRGYVEIWRTEGQSALMVLEKYAAKFKQVAASLPDTTINPLDASIPEKWWAQRTQFTLRFSFGTVKGHEEDGLPVPADTTFAGLYERAKETKNHPPYDLPPL